MQSDDFQSTGERSKRHSIGQDKDLAERIFADAGANETTRRFTWTSIKKNQVRTVFRVEAEGCVVFAKLHFANGFRQRFKAWFLGNPARREHETSQYAQSHGVPCVQVFAAGASRFGGQSTSMSLSHEIDDAESLADAFNRTNTSAALTDTRSLSASVAQLIATAHNARFLHADDHPGNILVQRTADGQSRCLYVDLYGSRCGQDISPSDAAASLASVGQWFADRTTRTHRLAVVKRYIQMRGWPTDRRFLKSFVNRILVASLKRRKILYRKRDKRIARNSAHFKHVKLADGWQSWITRRFRNQPELTGVEAPRWPESDLVGHLQQMFGIGTEASQSNPVINGPDDSVRFTSNTKEAWAWRWFGSPLRRQYMTACMAMNRDIPTALPIGLAEQRKGLGTSCTKQISVRPPQSVPIQTLMRQLPPESRRRLLERVGRHLAMTFDRGLVITNISPNNLEATSFKGQDVPIWVRIEGRGSKIPLPGPTRIWMLGQLATESRRAGIGNTVEMTRVLRACVRASFPGSQWKPLWRGVQDSMSLNAGDDESRRPTH